MNTPSLMESDKIYKINICRPQHMRTKNIYRFVEVVIFYLDILIWFSNFVQLHVNNLSDLTIHKKNEINSTIKFCKLNAKYTKVQ